MNKDGSKGLRSDCPVNFAVETLGEEITQPRARRVVGQAQILPVEIAGLVEAVERLIGAIVHEARPSG